MKKIIFGGFTMLTGAILLLAVFTAIGGGIDTVIRTSGWNPTIGMFWSAMGHLNLTPMFVIAIILMLTGFFIMLADVFAKQTWWRPVASPEDTSS